MSCMYASMNGQASGNILTSLASTIPPKRGTLARTRGEFGLLPNKMPWNARAPSEESLTSGWLVILRVYLYFSSVERNSCYSIVLGGRENRYPDVVT